MESIYLYYHECQLLIELVDAQLADGPDKQLQELRDRLHETLEEFSAPRDCR